MNPADKRRRGVAEVIPGRLYQRGQFLSWPAADKREMLRQLSVNVVVNLWRPIDSDLADERPGTRHNDAVYINWHMATNDVPKGASDLIRFLTSLMKQGNVVLVHCEAGRNRSAWLCARLVREFEYVDGHEAMDIIEKAIPRANIRKNLLDDIMESGYVYDGWVQ